MWPYSKRWNIETRKFLRLLMGKIDAHKGIKEIEEQLDEYGKKSWQLIQLVNVDLLENAGDGREPFRRKIAEANTD